MGWVEVGWVGADPGVKTRKTQAEHTRRTVVENPPKTSFSVVRMTRIVGLLDLTLR